MRPKFFNKNENLTLEDKIRLLRNNIRYITKSEINKIYGEIHRKDRDDLNTYISDIRSDETEIYSYSIRKVKDKNIRDNIEEIRKKHDSDFLTAYLSNIEKDDVRERERINRLRRFIYSDWDESIKYTKLFCGIYDGIALSGEESLIVIPYHILKQVVELDGEYDKQIEFGHFPTNQDSHISEEDIISLFMPAYAKKESHNNIEIVKENDRYVYKTELDRHASENNDVSTDKYKINGMTFDVAHGVSPKAIYKSLCDARIGRVQDYANIYYTFNIEPIKWDIYPELDIAVTHNILVNKSRNPKDYLENDFLTSILDDKTKNMINNRIVWKITYIKTLAKSTNNVSLIELIDRIIDEYNEKLDDVKEKVLESGLVFEDADTIETNFNIRIDTMLDNLKAYNKYLSEYEKIASQKSFDRIDLHSGLIKLDVKDIQRHDFKLKLDASLDRLKTLIDYAEEYIQMIDILSGKGNYPEDELHKDIKNLEENILPEVYDNEEVINIWNRIKQTEIDKYSNILDSDIERLEPKTTKELEMSFRIKLNEFLFCLCKHMNGADIIGDYTSETLLENEEAKVKKAVVDNYKILITNTINFIKPNALKDEVIAINELEKMASAYNNDIVRIDDLEALKYYTNILIQLYKIECSIDRRIIEAEKIESKKIK